MEEIVLMKQQLQEKEEVVSTLQTELRQKQEEQAAQKSIAMEEIVLMKQQLQEKEEVVSTLQTELRQKQEEQAAQLHKSLVEMDEINMMKQQLQENEALISTLQTELRQKEEEQAAQLHKNLFEIEDFSLMKKLLQEKQELISTLRIDLRQTQEKQAAQLHKKLFEIEDFSLMKKQLQEKEELISTLRTDLRLTQEEQDAQLSSMQQMVHEKDARFETQVRLHEDELLPLVTQADVETEMQQLEELKTLQQQYLLRNQEVIELLPLKAQLQEYQEQAETMQMMQEELRRESLAWQQELHQLRMEKSTWELHEKWMKEQYIMAIADKDEKLGRLQSLLRSSSQIPILSAQYQRQGPPNGLNPGVPQESNEKRDPEATGETQPRLGHSEVNPPRTSTIGTGGSPETSILIDVSDSSCGRTPSNAIWKRILPRSL
ncbi:uncharacterized protein LOC142843763 isoform X4 [Microtus pennsylvanicus]|uniref:uncharacterized protein LOC142843763 isoform X4 n=1 Tax=Microtus pennsylvanicus TaxID=10058 RepID=UPI003F6AEE49